MPHETTKKFWAALGDSAGVVAARINLDPKFLADLAALTVNLATADRKTNEKASILEHIAAVGVTGTDLFIAAEKFREGKTTDGVKIAWLGSNFKKNLLIKMETSIAPAMLRIQKLKERSCDVSILAELGDTAVIALAHVFEFLKTAGKSKLYVFYVADWVMYARWNTDSDDDGWFIEAYSVASLLKWDINNQVVSR